MKSTFKVLFYLKKNEPKKNGHVTIMIRVTVDGSNTQFSSKLDLHPDNWDVSKGQAKTGKGYSVQNAALNRLIESVKSELTVHYNRLMNVKGYALPEQIRNAFLGLEEKEKTLISYFSQFNDQYKQKVGTTATHKTYTRYELTKQRLIDFMKSKYHVSDMQVRELNTVFIENFYLYLRNTCEISNNTAMKFIQRFRTVLNYARNTGLDFIDPFANYKFNFDRVDRGYLEQTEIDSIWNKKFTSKRLEQVRDMFIFSTYTGLSYIDLCNLTQDNIKTGFDGKLWIMTKREKTGVDSNIPLLEIPRQILKKYEGKFKDGKLLPVISNQKMNDYLGEIAQICGINKKITFHLARHSFATEICITQGVPIESVSKMLGHTNIKTTQIYARVVDRKISHDMAVLERKINSRKQQQNEAVNF